jgi:hypothetical protein
MSRLNLKTEKLMKLAPVLMRFSRDWMKNLAETGLDLAETGLGLAESG